MIIDEEGFIEHYGILGMRWGVRKSNKERAADARARRKKNAGPGFVTRTHQKKINRIKKYSEGKASNKEKARLFLSTGLMTKKRAAKQIRLIEGSKEKVERGEKSALAIILRAQGVKVKDLDL